MTDEIINKIKTLLESKVGPIKIELTDNIKLEYDLGLTGTDAYEFLEEFVKEFNIEIGNFNVSTYFMPEGEDFFFSITRLFTGKKHPKQKELTIGDLKKVIIAGKLDETIIETTKDIEHF